MALYNGRNQKLIYAWANHRKEAEDLLLRVFRDFHGNMCDIAKRLSVSRNTLNLWIKESPRLHTGLQKIRNEHREQREAAIAAGTYQPKKQRNPRKSRSQ